MVSIIIVNFNTGDLLRSCLSSIKRSVSIPYEIVVVDNNSNDDSLKDLPDISELRIQREPVNHGFSKACNIGATLAKSSLYHFLNPDTEVSSDINEAYGLASRDQKSIYVTKIFDSQSGTDKSDHALPLLKNIWYSIFSPEKIARWYVGASFIVFHELYENLGRLSEDYFIYMDDVDFFYKAYRAGIKTIECPARVIHHQGGASRRVWTERQRLERVERSAIIFTRKFGLQFDYFVFKHVAFLRYGWRSPAISATELLCYWRELLRKTDASTVPH